MRVIEENIAIPIRKRLRHEVCGPSRDGLSPDSGRVVYVASDWELRRIGYFQRLAAATARLGLSRREIPNWIAEVIFSYEGLILRPNGDPFPISDTIVDDTFNNELSFRWLSDLIRFGRRRPLQRPQRRVLPRLRLLDLALKIEALER